VHSGSPVVLLNYSPTNLLSTYGVFNTYLKRVRVIGFRLEGVMPAVVTPFDKHEEFNEEAFRSLIDWLIEKGITGIVPCGTTGEFSLMSQPERAKIIETCVDQVNSSARVWVKGDLAGPVSAYSAWLKHSCIALT